MTQQLHYEICSPKKFSHKSTSEKHKNAHRHFGYCDRDSEQYEYPSLTGKVDRSVLLDTHEVL